MTHSPDPQIIEAALVAQPAPPVEQKTWKVHAAPYALRPLPVVDQVRGKCRRPGGALDHARVGFVRVEVRSFASTATTSTPRRAERPLELVHPRPSAFAVGQRSEQKIGRPLPGRRASSSRTSDHGSQGGPGITVPARRPGGSPARATPPRGRKAVMPRRPPGTDPGTASSPSYSVSATSRISAKIRRTPGRRRPSRC